MKHAAVYNLLNLSFSDWKLLGLILREEKYLERIIQLRDLLKWRDRVHVKLFYSIKEMEDYLSQRLPSWIIGTYVGDTVLLLDPDVWNNKDVGSLCQILVHEVTHVSINSISNSKCPIWLNEGLAVYMANQVDNFYVNEYIDNIYNLNYDTNNFYNICGNIVNKLISKYGLENVLKRIYCVKDYESDSIFCNHNIITL